jgi:3'-5' exoribonuclease
MSASEGGQPQLGMDGGRAARLCAELASGQSIAGGRYAVRSKRLVDFRNKPGQYLSLVLGDRSGEIQARAWDDAEALAARFEAGDVVAVTGRVETYQDRVQLIITDLVKCPAEEVRREDFLPKSERDPDEMLAELVAACKSVHDPGLRKLLAAFFADPDFVAQFKTCPGAKGIHHAYIGGLIEHTLNVVKICDNACDIYPQLDRDLLVAGALLHDIGKVREYSYDTSIEVTHEGGLIGHVVVGYQMVAAQAEKIPELTSEERLRIGHLMLAHHGEHQFGAPKLPMTAEACALHYGENLDAQVNGFLTAIAADRGQGKGWTEYIRRLERSLFLGGAEVAAPADDE